MGWTVGAAALCGRTAGTVLPDCSRPAPLRPPSVVKRLAPPADPDAASPNRGRLAAQLPSGSFPAGERGARALAFPASAREASPGRGVGCAAKGDDSGTISVGRGCGGLAFHTSGRAGGENAIISKQRITGNGGAFTDAGGA